MMKMKKLLKWAIIILIILVIIYLIKKIREKDDKERYNIPSPVFKKPGGAVAGGFFSIEDPLTINPTVNVVLSPEDLAIKQSLVGKLKPQNWINLPPKESKYTRNELEVIAKKFAPMCMLHAQEKFFPSSVDWYFNYVKPAWKTDDDGSGDKLFLETKEPVSAEDTLGFFAGEPPVELKNHPKYRVESRAQAYCSVINKEDGSFELNYLFFFPYNWGKWACIGIGSANTLGNRMEEFNFLDDVGGAFKSAYDYTKDKIIPTIGSGLETVGNFSIDVAKGAYNAAKSCLSDPKQCAQDYVVDPFKNLIESGCLGKVKRFGNHVGDIEGCNVYLDAQLNPTKLYFGAHDFNFELKWDEVTKVNDIGIINTTNKDNNTHPVLYLAYGSHGTWSTPGNHEYTPHEYPEDIWDADYRKGIATGQYKAKDAIMKEIDALKTRAVEFAKNYVIGLHLVDKTSSIDDGIPWMTWKDLRVFMPEEWSGQVPIPSALDKYGITNWLTQVDRWGNLSSEPSIFGQQIQVTGPSGMYGRYSRYTKWGDSVAKSSATAPSNVTDTNVSNFLKVQVKAKYGM